jgi:chromatin remodeling complex protein RSC6
VGFEEEEEEEEEDEEAEAEEEENGEEEGEGKEAEGKNKEDSTGLLSRELSGMCVEGLSILLLLLFLLSPSSLLLVSLRFDLFSLTN